MWERNMALDIMAYTHATISMIQAPMPIYHTILEAVMYPDLPMIDLRSGDETENIAKGKVYAQMLMVAGSLKMRLKLIIMATTKFHSSNVKHPLAYAFAATNP